ncbi:MAG: HAMP domain-containing sensor histidine kinase [Bacteroidetes bacterium]|nr:HAMP domain-containing sensor histidine kinase [Bacteroidota bacterium]
MNKLLKYSICYWLLFFLIISACAAQEGYSWKKYEINNLLPENHVKQIERDKNGFYWIITGGGVLIRWNGSKSFRFFETTTPEGKKIEQFNMIKKDGTGNLYLQTDNGQQFFYVDNKSIPRYLNMQNAGTNYCWSYYGNLTVVNESWEMIRKNNAHPVYDEFKNLVKNRFLPSEYLSFTVKDSAAYFVNEVDHSFFFYQNGIIKKIKQNLTGRQGAFILGKYFGIYTKDSVYLFHKEKRVGSFPNRNIPLPMNRYSFVLQSFYPGSAAFFESDNKIYKVSFENGKLIVAPFFLLPANNPKVGSFYVDEPNGRLFICDMSGGFTVYQHNFYYFRTSGPTPQYNTVYSLAEVNGTLLKTQDFLEKVSQQATGYYNWHAPIIRLKTGNFFYPGSLGFFLFNDKRHIIRRWPFDLSWAIRSALLRNDDVYISAGELIRFNSKTNELTNVPLPVEPEDKGAMNYLAEGPSGLIYAAIGYHIYEIDLTKNSARIISPRLKEKTIGAVRGMFYDKEYRVIFLSIKGILHYLDPAKETLVQFPASGNLDMLSCHYILRDQDGDCWLPTNTGLYFMSKEQLRAFMTGASALIAYQPANVGIGGEKEEFNGGFTNSGLCIGDSLYLSSMHGIVTFSAKEAKRLLQEGRISGIQLNQLILDGVTVPVDSNKIILPPGFKRCEFYTDIAFSNITGAGLEYRLISSKDTSVQLMPDNNMILLQSLFPGTYELRVNVVNHPEIEPLVLTIVAKQYWNKTTAAFIAYFIFAATLLYILFAWRIQRIRNASLREVDKSRKELFTIISHDLRSPLKAYQGLAEMISYLLKNKRFDSIGKVAEQIDSTGIKLDLLMSNLLNWNLLQQDKIVAKKELVDIADVIEENVSIYREIALSKNTSIEFSAAGPCVVPAHKDMVALMIRNLLDNAFKNAPDETAISVSLTKENQGFRLQVSNAIKAASAQKLQYVSELLESPASWEPGSKGMGIGLKMVQLAAQKSGGKLGLHVDKEKVNFYVHLN